MTAIMNLGIVAPKSLAPYLTFSVTPLTISAMAFPRSIAAVTQAIVPLIMKIAFIVDSITMFPIPAVKIPKRTCPTTLPVVTPAS